MYDRDGICDWDGEIRMIDENGFVFCDGCGSAIQGLPADFTSNWNEISWPLEQSAVQLCKECYLSRNYHKFDGMQYVAERVVK